jgi:putative phosphoribosyl transferase
MAIETDTVRETLRSYPVRIPAREVVLTGGMTIPKDATALVLFSGEAGQDGRQLYQHAIARIFNKYKLATLLPDLQTFAKNSRPDASLQADQLEHMTRWARENSETASLHVGYFSTGAGAGAALAAAARQAGVVRAVVVRGGRMDNALEFLPLVKAPVLLIAGGRDPEGLRASQSALEKLNSASTLNVVPSASHSFDEPGVMEEAAQLAALWFLHHLE